MYRKLLVVLVLFGLVRPGTLNSQEEIPPPASRLFAGGTLLFAQPEGEFRDYVSRGFGLGGHALVQLDRTGIFALRADAGFVNYGRETQRVPFSSTVGGRVMVDVATTNNILFLGIGPQLMLPDGRLRPYVNGTAGASYFFTQSEVTGVREDRQIAQTTNQDDFTFSYGGGAGIYIPLHRGTSAVSLDLGGRYLVNGEARYLREGSIRDEPDGSISFAPIRSETNFFTFHVGISVRLPHPDAVREQACVQPPR